MSALVKKNKYLISLNITEDVPFYKNIGISTFLLPLKDYSIGYLKTFNTEEINSFREKKVVLINQVLNTKKIEELIDIIPKIDVDTFMIEDVGLIDILRKLNKKIILFINHFNCNYESINIWLEYVDSVVVSNELTIEELEVIDKYSKKSLCYHLLGYNQVMYSKRKLLTNYAKHYNLDNVNKRKITDTLGNTKFNVYEDIDGTIIYSDKIFFDKRILHLDNVKYFYINTSFLTKEKVLDILNGIDTNVSSGFLDRETVFKVGDLK